MLKAKRRMLQFPSGFMSHFYAISEQMSPLMAWGFLGPDEGLREICLYFKVSMFHAKLDNAPMITSTHSFVQYLL